MRKKYALDRNEVVSVLLKSNAIDQTSLHAIKMFVSNKGLVIFCYAVLFFMSGNTSAQSATDITLKPPKRFLGKVELFGGPCLWIPNDHGWAEYQSNSSDHQMISKFRSETGYQFGVGFTHTINKRLEVQARISKVRVHYSERQTFFDVYGQVSNVWIFDQKNDQIVLSLIPSYFFSDKNRLHIFGGVSYSLLIRSMDYATYSTGGHASINTINAFERHVINALLGVGYSYPINKKMEVSLKVQGDYGLSDTLNDNGERISVNGISTSIGLRFSSQ